VEENKMGSYSTAEVSSGPRSIRESYSGSGGSPRPTPRLETEAPTVTRQDVNAALPTIMALGGGLSTSRIVKKVPDEVKVAGIGEAVRYLLGAATSPEELAVKEQVEQRMGRADYRFVINSQYNLHNSGATASPVRTYFKPSTREVDGQRVQLNMVDLAIISHEEGGRAEKTLESRL